MAVKISKFYKCVYTINKVRYFSFNYNFNLYQIYVNALTYFNNKFKIFCKLYLKLVFINI